VREDRFGWSGRDIEWLSPVGPLDDFGNVIGDSFVDGQTLGGAWAIMTPECHRANGGRLGQLYRRQPDGRWVCTGD
jgi:hypothetical protein